MGIMLIPGAQLLGMQKNCYCQNVVHESAYIEGLI